MCQRAQDCHNGQVCDEYNVGGMLHGFCTPPIPGAPGGAADDCSAPGDDASCQTGLCAVDAKDSLWVSLVKNFQTADPSAKC